MGGEKGRYDRQRRTATRARKGPRLDQKREEECGNGRGRRSEYRAGCGWVVSTLTKLAPGATGTATSKVTKSTTTGNEQL